MVNRPEIKIFVIWVAVLGFMSVAFFSFAQKAPPAAAMAAEAAKVEPGKVAVPFTQELMDRLNSA